MSEPFDKLRARRGAKGRNGAKRVVVISLLASLVVSLAIALRTVVGGRVLEFAAPSDLGLAAAVFPVLCLLVPAMSAAAGCRAGGVR